MKTNRYVFVFLASMALLCPYLKAGTNYVSLTGSHTAPFFNWATAATNIQDAVDFAVGGDIVLVSNGTYVLSSEIVIIDDITVKGLNGPDNTIIDGDNSVRCMNLGNTLSVLDGFTVQRGKKDSGPINGYGGGVYCEGYNPVITNCIFTLNSGWYGGAVFGGTLHDNVFDSNQGLAGGAIYEGLAYDCTFYSNNATDGGAVIVSTIESCLLYNNSSSRNGGAIYLGTATSCIVSNNYSAQDGGGLASTHVVNSTVINNFSARDGGGAYRCTVSNSYIVGNTASEDGGGIHGGSAKGSQIKNNIANDNGGGLYETGATNCVLITNDAGDSGGGAYHSTIVSCQIISNSAYSSGGLISKNQYAPVINSLIMGNSAEFNHGGVRGGAISNCTIVANVATYSGGVGNNDSVYNSIIWGNQAPNFPNIIGVEGIVINCSSPDLTHGVDGNITNNPWFFGAVTNNYRLTINSPCINAGDNAFVSTATDLAGNVRISEGVVDMGAYEYVGLDMDGDIMSDAWEVQFFGSAENVTLETNNDGDDYLDWQEFILGSNPTNGDSAFVFENNSDSSTNGFGMDFTSATGRLYTVECTAELGSDNWTFLTNILGSGSVVQLIDPAQLSNCFYRVHVELDR